MADRLIQHLKDKEKEHSALSLLVNQWGFDEKLIPKALQTIGSIFPHYSRHDESHSKQILINIERLLGDDIKLLTATDTWLLLEAAYWHDIGMVVPQSDIEEALATPEFEQYLDSIRREPNNPLHIFAKSFDTKKMTTCFSGSNTPLEAVESFRNLMAEWFRRQHPARAEKIIQTPWDSAGISSPRTELIPARLFKLLGRVCQMHGAPFEEILGPKGLPFREAGLAQEDCHPRFIACLLRMGDLLDLDDNRFCPVMQRIAGENRPQLTKAHEDKHAGIRHLRIDRERIEISAECSSIDGYLETFNWFNWLKQEIQYQMVNWQDIVPSRDLGLLPTLGALEVRLSGKLQILNEGQKPQFGLDTKKAIELLQGNNLYSSKYSCIRELLQNAVDATLLKIWLLNEKKLSPTDYESPYTAKMQELLSAASVKATLTELGSGSNPEKSRWRLTISDEGTGISLDDLGYMLQIGGSHRNTERQNRINTMPEWMKPSGTFGIGLQSIFLLCDEITITTKSVFTNQLLKVTLHSPTGAKDGLVSLELMEHDFAYPFGTEINVEFELDKFSRHWGFYLDDTNTVSSRFLGSMDPVLHEDFPLDAARIADKFLDFSKQSIIKITPQLITKDGEKHVEFGIELSKDNNKRLINIGGHQLTLTYKPHLTLRDQPTSYFRGQPFEYKGPSIFLYVQVQIDLMSGQASSWLTASREHITGAAQIEFKKTVLAALKDQVKYDLARTDECSLLQGENRQTYSIFLEAMAVKHKGEWHDLAKELSREWLSIECIGPSNYKTYKDAFDAPSLIVGLDSSLNYLSKGLDLIFERGSTSYLFDVFLKEWLSESDRTMQIIDAKKFKLNNKDRGSSKILDNYKVYYLLKKEAQPYYDINALANTLASQVYKTFSNKRCTLHCEKNSKWSNLFLEPETKLRAHNLFEIIHPNSDIVLLPYLFRSNSTRSAVSIECTEEQLDSLCKWVQLKLKSKLSLDEVKRTYQELINYIDNTVMECSPHKKEWRKYRGLPELS